MSSTFAILIALVVVILLIVLIIILINRKDPEITVVKKNQRVPIEMPSSIGLFLPETIEKIGPREAYDIAKKVFESYKYFDYHKKNSGELDNKEWHTWQVSLILQLFKHNEELFVPNKQDVFHPFLLNSTEDDIKSLMNGIIKKYKTHAEINRTKDYLSKDYIWSTRDISIIFYFLANYKNYKN